MAKFDSEWENPLDGTGVASDADDGAEDEGNIAYDGGMADPSGFDDQEEGDDGKKPEVTFADPEIEHYRKELANDLRLTKGDGSLDLAEFKTKTFMESATRGKWLSYLYKEKEILAQLKDKRSEFERAVSEKIRSGTGSGFEKQKRIEEFFKTSSAMSKLSEAAANQQRKIDFLIEANDIMSKFGYTIRNGLDFLKLQFA